MSSKRAVAVAAWVLAASTSTQADAASQRTFVASYGLDANPCTLVAPCRSFATAIAATTSQGEVVVLDSAGYGPVTVGQAVSIVAPAGVYAGVSVLTGVGVLVAAGADDKVTLRGLTINGQGGARGITISSAAEVSIDNCVITNMTDAGIFVFLGAGSPRIQVRETLVRGNGGAGLWISGDGTPSVQISDSQFVRNGWDALPHPGGILASSGVLNAQRVVANDNAPFGVLAASDTAAGVVVTLSDSEVSHNSGGGAIATVAPVTGGTATLTVVRSTLAANGGNGLVADGTAAATAITVAASDSAVTDNAGGGIVVVGATANALVTRSTIARNVAADLANVSGVLRSSGNNTLTGRGAADVQGTITANPPQ